MEWCGLVWGAQSWLCCNWRLPKRTRAAWYVLRIMSIDSRQLHTRATMAVVLLAMLTAIATRATWREVKVGWLTAPRHHRCRKQACASENDASAECYKLRVVQPAQRNAVIAHSLNKIISSRAIQLHSPCHFSTELTLICSKSLHVAIFTCNVQQFIADRFFQWRISLHPSQWSWSRGLVQLATQPNINFMQNLVTKNKLC